MIVLYNFGAIILVVNHMKKNDKSIVNFFFEIGILSKTPRGAFKLLRTGEQSVGEHITRVAYIGYALAKLDKKVDANKVIKICLFHDLAESRVSDLNYMQKKYVVSDEYKAIKDLAETLEFGNDILDTYKEYEDRKSKESFLAKDADILEWILTLKEQIDIGNKRVRTWIPPALKRLNTAVGKRLAKEILKSDLDDWWYGNKKDKWWINREKSLVKKRK